MTRAMVLLALVFGCSSPDPVAVPDEPTCSEYGFHLSVGVHLELRYAEPAQVFAVHGRADIGPPGTVVRLRTLESDGTLAVVGGWGVNPAVEIRSCNGARSVWPIASEALP